MTDRIANEIVDRISSDSSVKRELGDIVSDIQGTQGGEAVNVNFVEPFTTDLITTDVDKTTENIISSSEAVSVVQFDVTSAFHIVNKREALRVARDLGEELVLIELRNTT